MSNVHAECVVNNILSYSWKGSGRVQLLSESGVTEGDGVQSDKVQIIGRQYELSIIEDTLQRCLGGTGQLLAFEGPQGIGKSELLGAIESWTSNRKVKLLKAAGSDLEMDFNYGVVRQLFEPCVAAATAGERDEVMTGGWTLAAPLFDYVDGKLISDDEPRMEQSFFLGLYSMCIKLSERDPVVVVVDDAHWADAPSLRFLHYLSRRLSHHRIFIAVAVEAGAMEKRSYLGGLARALIASSIARFIRLNPLSEADVREVIVKVLNRNVENDFASACHYVTGGNPLFLRKLLLEISSRRPEYVDSVVMEPDTVSQIVPKNLAGAVLRQLNDAAIAVAEAAAVLGTAADLLPVAEVAELDSAEAAKAAGSLMDTLILYPEFPLRFAHPIIRTCIYHNLPPSFRYRIHARAAHALETAGHPAEDVAEHLVCAAPSGDPWVVRVLSQAGRSVLRQGNPKTAVTYLRRALHEPPSNDSVAAIMAELGAAEFRAWRPEAVDRLLKALEIARNPHTRARIAIDLAFALASRAQYEDALRLIHQTKKEADSDDSELAEMLDTALLSILWHAPQSHRLVASKGIYDEKPGCDGENSSPILRMLHRAEGFNGATRAETIIEFAQTMLTDFPQPAKHDVLPAACISALMLIFCGRLSDADRLLTELFHESSQRGHVLAANAARALRAWARCRRGSLREAEADARNVLSSVTTPLLDVGVVSFAAAALVDCLVARGELTGATQELERLGYDTELPSQAIFAPLLSSRGRLRISQGEMESGLLDLMRCRSVARDWAAPGFSIGAAADVTITLARLGRMEEAGAMAEETLSLARDFGSPQALAAALLASGVVADDRNRIGMLSEAADILADTPARPQHAATLIQLGGALRRTGSRAHARQHLRSAFDIAVSCGASALADQARIELAAAGVRMGAARRHEACRLTARERQVAKLAAEGKANGEIARILFVTVKTVEWHLGQAYRKLGIASRYELRQALATKATAYPGKVDAELTADGVTRLDDDRHWLVDEHHLARSLLWCLPGAGRQSRLDDRLSNGRRHFWRIPRGSRPRFPGMSINARKDTIQPGSIHQHADPHRFIAAGTRSSRTTVASKSTLAARPRAIILITTRSEAMNEAKTLTMMSGTGDNAAGTGQSRRHGPGVVTRCLPCLLDPGK
jgi:DNA-binding CsgD family transcriptional regulator